MKVWIDIKNSHEPLFFKSIDSSIIGVDFFYTYRDFAEIKKLMLNYNLSGKQVGNRPEGDIFKRRLMFLMRVLNLALKVPRFDLSLSHFSGWSIWASKLRNKPIICVTDNDINPDNSKFFPYINLLFTPKAISKESLQSQGLKETSLVQFDGFKEDIYIADYVPDEDFLDNLPFNNFVTIRPESTQATYNKGNRKSIVPSLLDIFTSNGINVLYLPRYKSDIDYADGNDRIYIPKDPLNGLDICFFSKMVLTGAGTFSREAACMGKNAVSFFPGKKLLAVDKAMIDSGKVFHSRNPLEIYNFFKDRVSVDVDLERSKDVKKAFMEILNKIVRGYDKRSKLVNQ